VIITLLWTSDDNSYAFLVHTVNLRLLYSQLSTRSQSAVTSACWLSI